MCAIKSTGEWRLSFVFFYIEPYHFISSLPLSVIHTWISVAPCLEECLGEVRNNYLENDAVLL